MNRVACVWSVIILAMLSVSCGQESQRTVQETGTDQEQEKAATSPRSAKEESLTGGFEKAIRGLESGIEQLEVQAGQRRVKREERFQPPDRSRIRVLIDMYRDLDAGPRREEVVESLSVQFPLFAKLAPAAEVDAFLPFFRGVLEGSKSRRERKLASIALHDVTTSGVSALLADSLSSQYPEVRFYAAEGLAWCVRGGVAEAIGPLRSALEHSDPRVRGIAGISIAVISPGLREATPLILAALSKESDPDTAQRLALAVLKLNPKDGALRVRASVAERPTILEAVGEVLARKSR